MWLEERELSEGWAEGCVLDVTLLSILTIFKTGVVMYIFQIWMEVWRSTWFAPVLE